MPNQEAQPKVSLENMGYSKAHLEALQELAAVPGQPFEGLVTGLPVGLQTVPQPPALNALQRETLRKELSRDDLSIYTAVRLARKDVEVGHFDSAISRLRIDADKLRMHGSVLTELIKYQYPN